MMQGIAGGPIRSTLEIRKSFSLSGTPIPPTQKEIGLAPERGSDGRGKTNELVAVPRGWSGLESLQQARQV
jgi:hypothetical protein